MTAGGAVVVAVVAGAVSLVIPPAGGPADPTAAAGPFAAASPFNMMIEAGAPVDSNSSAMIAAITREGVFANLVEFGIPIYDADSNTPRHTVRCRQAAAWGSCPLAERQVPIPDGARPQAGSDGSMVVVDRAGGEVFEFWQAVAGEASWTASWGSVGGLGGDGWSSTATGSGASRLGGVIRIAEVKAGLIPHALVVASSNACAGALRPPATKTDGSSTTSDCIPEGSRLQLDPGLDISAIEDMTTAERAIATALQTYGAYVIDTGGAPMTMSFERAADATQTTAGADYDAVGLPWDYYSLTGVPWTELRVLSSWNGA